MSSIVLASTNKGKVKEFQEIFEPLGIEILPLSKFGNIPEVDETADTFEGNAKLKALTISKILNRPVIADDSGLCIHGLDNRPGVLSARSFGVEKNGYPAGYKVLWSEMAEKTPDNSSAHFECCLVLGFPNDKSLTWTGEVSGKISKEARGGNGFGYDPIFVPDGYDKTFAELDIDTKNLISHRGRAIKAFLADRDKWERLL